MFEAIVRFSIRKKLFVALTTLFLLIGGLYAMFTLPIDAVPDITNNQVQIVTVSPTLSPQEVEKLITMPVETSMSNIMNVTEIRSISRFGLSLVTVVFKESVPTLEARQLINEQIQTVAGEIPSELGTPEMMPISTGLGEIYQYILKVDEEHKDQYDAMELRTIQDWIVKRQLSGIPGIVEINSFGGYLKQYEIAIDPELLAALQLTIGDIYDALSKNNQNTGGSYIEKVNRSYYIRSEGMIAKKSDIEKIVVANRGGMPVHVSDIGRVSFGSPKRFGAMTMDGEGECVGGIAMMLKGANANVVTQTLEERVAKVQKILPEGITIEPYLNRSELVNRNISTVVRNLIEGALIVFLVLMLFLGNVRAGIIVSSVIPLAMLFGFILMRIFGVSANLMSLGAIDFGMIVDSAVIIVEAVVTHINRGDFSQPGVRAAYIARHTVGGGFALTQAEMDAEVHYSASRIRQSAAFGEIIIMIVYIPLMTLVGIEGKMFRPMAFTVFFAILGAFILSLTYVPMASSLFLSRKVHTEATFSDRMISRLQTWYRPVLEWVLRRRKDVITAAVALCCVSVVGLKFLGGEFIPSLDEGDFAVEMSMAQGTSLSQMVETCTKAEKLLKSEYPEVKQVVSRIGSAEIPTDPMPVERADIMVALKPKAEWTSATTTSDLMEKMEATLKNIPGMEAEFSQPIQMRNNELLTGIKQDVAIKIFGDDLNTLIQQAEKVGKMISNVRGVSGVMVEQVAGLPQIQVRCNHERMAEYGVSVDDVNQVLETAFAGGTAGVVFEGERKFDIVLRLDKDVRTIEALQTLAIPVSAGQQEGPAAVTVPLNQLADIVYETAPAQVSHEDGARRIYVGFNVKGRDVQSTVDEIQHLLDSKLQLPDGYYYTYGGEFKNLQSAVNRLMIVVPLALVIILLLLYATVKSVRESLFVFSAIPFAAIGGVWALWLRDMPFSISAGVGFIALFGVSVLNGIVLIGQMNQMQREGVTDVQKRIIDSCMVRLRPVLMTALVASMGFLPMALSHGDGAEVQRPLATVVIGGLITSTLLTLLVLPAIYKTFTKGSEELMK